MSHKEPQFRCYVGHRYVSVLNRIVYLKLCNVSKTKISAVIMTLKRLKSANSKKNIIRDVLVINILYINQHKNVATTFNLMNSVILT